MNYSSRRVVVLSILPVFALLVCTPHCSAQSLDVDSFVDISPSEQTVDFLEVTVTEDAVGDGELANAEGVNNEPQVGTSNLLGAVPSTLPPYGQMKATVIGSDDNGSGTLVIEAGTGLSGHAKTFALLYSSKPDGSLAHDYSADKVKLADGSFYTFTEGVKDLTEAAKYGAYYDAVKDLYDEYATPPGPGAGTVGSNYIASLIQRACTEQFSPAQSPSAELFRFEISSYELKPEDYEDARFEVVPTKPLTTIKSDSSALDGSTTQTGFELVAESEVSATIKITVSCALK